jgi:two-component system, NarL family, invasion response regulator UvrY
MIRVFIVDDHAIVREGVKRIILDTTDIEVAGEAEDGVKATRDIPAGACDVVLLDLNLPGMDGFDVLRTLKAGKSPPSVIILSIFPEEDYAVRAYKEGAMGYLTKESLPGELIHAIRRVASGKKYVSESMGERLMSDLTGTLNRPPHESLSTREYQVFRLIIAGKTIKEIAATLSVAPTTVSSYRARIFEKMEISNNLDLMRYSIEHHLAD